MATFILSNGPVSLTIEDADCDTLSDVLDRYSDQFNIPANASAQVDGHPANRDTVIPEGAEVAFSKPTGSKGRTR